MGKKLKISSTAYRVLLLLLHLNNGKCTSDYLNNLFIDDPYISRYYSKDVILKYIITLRTAGYSITKPTLSNGYNYELDQSPVLIELTDNQVKNLAILSCYAESLHQNKMVKNYSSFLKKIKKFLSQEQIVILDKEIKKQHEILSEVLSKYEPYKELITKIENFKEENQRVSIKYKIPASDEEKQIVLELKNIKYENKEIYVAGFSPLTDQTHSIKLEQITEIKQLPTKSQYKQILSPVIFKLKGNLAKVYRPYENEKVSPSQDRTKSITVTSYVDDHNILIKRLLKYGENCEILYPKHTKMKMINIISSALENYEKEAVS